jgi:hypothetical protein
MKTFKQYIGEEGEVVSEPSSPEVTKTDAVATVDKPLKKKPATRNDRTHESTETESSQHP